MPEPLARAIACGVTVSFIPVFGMHAIMGFAMALLIGANPIAAAAASLLIPPVILPLIFSLDFLVGRKILRFCGFYGQGNENTFVQQATEGTNYIANHLDEFIDHFNQFFLPALVGAFVFMLLVWPASYMAAHKLIEVIERHHKLHKHTKTPK